MKIEFYIDFIKWFSCVCLHMGHQTRTTWPSFYLFKRAVRRSRTALGEAYVLIGADKQGKLDRTRSAKRVEKRPHIVRCGRRCEVCFSLAYL